MNKIISKLFTLLFAITFLFTNVSVYTTYAAATGVPGKPALTHNQWGNDTDGEYDITCNMWYGNNATSYTLYERIGIKGEFKAVANGTLVDDTPNKQSFVVNITGRTTPGTYYYYAELTNSYGTTAGDTINLKVGSADESKIVIDKVDDEKTALQFTVSQGESTYKLINVDSQTPNFTVISSNTSAVKASIVDNDTLKIDAIAAGRSGLRIEDTTTKEVRQIGVRVREANGSLSSMPSYVSIGQVSEDTTNDLDFWKDIDTDDTNKRCDIRYIYVNGGPISGWRTWTTEDGARVKTYIKESLKMGMIPYFVYYNIPDDKEDYNVDLQHINDKTYMEAYYKDLKFFLDICNEYAGDETVGIVLEPDFLGYMMQQSGKKPSEIAAAGVESLYTSGILENNTPSTLSVNDSVYNTTKAKVTYSNVPTFPNTVTGLVESINYIINETCPNANFGWQFNTWGYSEIGVPGKGLMHSTETMGFEEGRAFIKTAAEKTAEYYMDAGILSNGADFISIDKYGLDGAYEAGAAEDPESSRWLWNADMWNNYLFYTKTLHETTKFPVTLWQLPVGHLNSSQEPNPYGSALFPDLTNAVGLYEDSAPTFFFGDSFKPGSDKRMQYFSTNVANDPKVTVNGDTITYGNHIQEANDAGVTTILFGAGVGASTDAVGSPPADSYWWITKAQRYFQNPVPLK